MANFFIGVFVFSSLIGQVRGYSSILIFHLLISMTSLWHFTFLFFFLSDERRHRSSYSSSDILPGVNGWMCCLHEHLYDPQASPEQSPHLVQLHLGSSGNAGWEIYTCQLCPRWRKLMSLNGEQGTFIHTNTFLHKKKKKTKNNQSRPLDLVLLDISSC